MPAAIVKRRKLRVLGTEISLLPQIRRQAAADLGIDVEFVPRDFLSCQRQAALQPRTYDVYDQCFHNIDIVWFWGALQPIDSERITEWQAITPLARSGGISKYASRGFGDAPVRRLYVQPGHVLGPEPSRLIGMLPTIHNFDAFGYDARAFPEMSPGQESWAMLFDPRVAGRASLVDEPAIGFMDAAIAAEASGAVGFDDIGNLTIVEIDRLMAVLRGHRQNGHFRPMWSTSRELADQFVKEGVAVSSLWSPALGLIGPDIPYVREAVPVEGYRAWHGGLSLAAHLADAQLDAAYDYLNWWLSGFAGAMMARQGYYMSNPQTVRAHLTAAEWDYWYAGEPAAADLPGTDGQTTVVRAGSRRAGGSYAERAGRVAIWNTAMDEHNYVSRAWARLRDELAGKAA